MFATNFIDSVSISVRSGKSVSGSAHLHRSDLNAKAVAMVGMDGVVEN